MSSELPLLLYFHLTHQIYTDIIEVYIIRGGFGRPTSERQLEMEHTLNHKNISVRQDFWGNLPQGYDDIFWGNLRKQAAIDRIPIHGHFELTPRCNFDCKMCYVHLAGDQLDQPELTFEEWKKIIDEAIDAGMVFASLSGGECLLVPYFDELYLYLKSKGILVFVLTNGYLLSEKLPLFQAHPPAHIQISVYGHDAESYRNVTGRDRYHRVYDAIHKAEEMGLPIGIAVTASKYLPSVFPIVEHFYKCNIGVSVNKWLIPPHDSTGRYLKDFILSPAEQVEIDLELLRATEQQMPRPATCDLPECGGQMHKELRGLSCAAGRTDFSISWKGEMMPCVSLPYPVGTPLSEGFASCWNAAVRYADSALLPIECSGCAYEKVCNRCYAFHLIHSEAGHCNPSACEEIRLSVSRGIASLD